MNDRFRNNPVQSAQTASIPTSAAGVQIDDDARKVLRNTWALLAMTLLFCAGTATIAMVYNFPFMGFWAYLIGIIGFIFLINMTSQSAWGLLSIFAFTGFLGLAIGPVISFYLSNFINGHALVISAFGATGAAFAGLTIFGLTTKKDFSFLGPFLFAGIIVGLVLAVAAYVFQLGMLSLAISGMFALLMSAYIVYETQQIVRGGQRNYILAATSLFISIFSIFSNLLHLFGFFFGEE